MLDESNGAVSASQTPSPHEWQVAVDVLAEQLGTTGGCVSSLALRKALASKGIKDPRPLIVSLRYFDFENPIPGVLPPPFKWRHHGKSFYSVERYQRLLETKDTEATNAEQAVAAAPANEEEDDSAPAPEKRRSRQEERRLGTYVASALESIYQSDHAPDDAPYVFDVHSDRAGNEFENVDVLTVHWRTPKRVELVTVEVKLDFTARLVQQAKNYMRFSDRVWIAVPVLAEAADASAALRDFDPALFEHVVEVGLGILACRRRPGRSYEAVPVQWPRRCIPDLVEKDQFIERYRQRFEDANVIARRAEHRYPAIL